MHRRFASMIRQHRLSAHQSPQLNMKLLLNTPQFIIQKPEQLRDSHKHPSRMNVEIVVLGLREPVRSFYYSLVTYAIFLAGFDPGDACRRKKIK